MRLDKREFNKGYILDKNKLEILLNLGKEMIDAAPELSKSMNAPVSIYVNITFMDSTHFDNIKLNELDTLLESAFNSRISEITIYSNNKYASDELNFEFNFNMDYYTYKYNDTNIMRFTKYKNDINKFFDEEIANSKLYTLLSNQNIWFYPIVFSSIIWGNYFLTNMFPFNDIAKVFLTLISILIAFSLFFLPKLFPKGRILIGVNKKIEEKYEKRRKYLWTFILYPVIGFIIQLITDNFLFK